MYGNNLLYSTALARLRMLKFGFCFFAIAAWIGSAEVVFSADIVWDADTGTAGAQDGSGSWNSSNTNWLTAVSNNVAWVDSDGATVGSGGTPGTITLGESISASSLTINDDYTFALGASDFTMGGLYLADNVIAYANGSGTLTLNSAPPIIGAASAGNSETLDLRNLATFVLSTPSSDCKIGGQSGGDLTWGYLYLAETSTVTVAYLGIGDKDTSPWSGNVNISGGVLYLGQSNIINADTIQLGAIGQPQGKMLFQSGLTDPSLTIRGTAGGDSRANITIGKMYDVYANPGGSYINLSTGVTGSSVLDARIETMIVAYGSGLANSGSGSFTMDAGVLDATLIRLSEAGSGGDSRWTVGVATGTFTQNGGTVTASTLMFAYDHGYGRCSGTYVLNSGELGVGLMDRGSGTITGSTLNWNGGTICNIDSGTDLSVDAGISLVLGSTNLVFDIDSDRTGTINATISGSGSFSKTGSGMLELTAANTFTGNATISAGGLHLSAAGALGTTNCVLAVANGVLVTIDTGINETIKTLYLGGAKARTGTWGSTSSAAEFKHDGYFSGEGMLTISTGGQPGSRYRIR